MGGAGGVAGRLRGAPPPRGGDDPQDQDAVQHERGRAGRRARLTGGPRGAIPQRGAHRRGARDDGGAADRLPLAARLPLAGELPALPGAGPLGDGRAVAAAGARRARPPLRRAGRARLPADQRRPPGGHGPAGGGAVGDRSGRCLTERARPACAGRRGRRPCPWSYRWTEAAATRSRPASACWTTCWSSWRSTACLTSPWTPPATSNATPTTWWR